MKLSRFVIIAGVVAVTAACSSGRIDSGRREHRVVMEVSTDDPTVWEAVLNNVENVRAAFGSDATAVTLVAHGGGLQMLLRSNTAQMPRMEKLAAGGVVFAACENTMLRKKVSRSDLLPFATTVDSGVAEVVRKQEQGWSYVKSGF